MKILTKEWMKKYEQVRVINCIEEIDLQKVSYEEIQKLSKDKFYDGIYTNRVLAKLAFDSNLAQDLYGARIDRDKTALLELPEEVFSKIKNIELVFLGYACKEDKEMLMEYSNKLYAKLEMQAEESNKITKRAQKHLIEELDFDFLIGELVYDEYVKGKDYFIVVDGNTICVENYKIVEREDFKINEFDIKTPLSIWTRLDAMELYYINQNCFELHILFANCDEFEKQTFWCLTLKGTNVKFVKEN